jgi:hypothetical protein
MKRAFMIESAGQPRRPIPPGHPRPKSQLGRMAGSGRTGVSKLCGSRFSQSNPPATEGVVLKMPRLESTGQPRSSLLPQARWGGPDSPPKGEHA